MTFVKISQPDKGIWQITLCSPPDNRLTPELLSELSKALDEVEKSWRESGGGKPKSKSGGALVLTSGVDKFFSNGLDWERSLGIKNFFEELFDPVMWRLLTFPLVTIAAINGHAFAGGMIMALCCDYRVITSGRGYLCMNEVTFGSPLPNSFNALLAIRIPNQQNLRDTLLARRWTQKELLDIGLIDQIVDLDKVVSTSIDIGLREGGKVALGSWGSIKRGIYHPVLEASKSYRPLLLPPQEEKDFWGRMGSTDRKAKAKL